VFPRAPMGPEGWDQGIQVSPTQRCCPVVRGEGLSEGETGVGGLDPSSPDT
jgi:hypothetical protein